MRTLATSLLVQSGGTGVGRDFTFSTIGVIQRQEEGKAWSCDRVHEQGAAFQHLAASGFNVLK